MKLWGSLLVIALFAGSSTSIAARGGGQLTTWFNKLGHSITSNASQLLRTATGLGVAGIFACTMMSCDTRTVIKVTETVETEREVRFDSYQEMYYVIEGVAYPYHVVSVPYYGTPQYGYPEVVNYDCDSVPMEVIYETDVPEHEYIGADVAYLSPPPNGYIDPYYNYGKVKKYYGDGFYEVEVLAWSESYTYTERTKLTRTYTVLIDASLSSEEGGIILDNGVNAALNVDADGVTLEVEVEVNNTMPARGYLHSRQSPLIYIRKNNADSTLWVCYRIR